jgi:hypothetical protein
MRLQPQTAVPTASLLQAQVTARELQAGTKESTTTTVALNVNGRIRVESAMDRMLAMNHRRASVQAGGQTAGFGDGGWPHLRHQRCTDHRDALAAPIATTQPITLPALRKLLAKIF